MMKLLKFTGGLERREDSSENRCTMPRLSAILGFRDKKWGPCGGRRREEEEGGVLGGGSRGDTAAAADRGGGDCHGDSQVTGEERRWRSKFSPRVAPFLFT